MTDTVDLFQLLKRYTESQVVEHFPFKELRNNRDIDKFISIIARFSDQSKWVPEEILLQEKVVEIICFAHNILIAQHGNSDPEYYFEDDEYLEMIETILGWYEDTIWQY
jgi:hypothetical protein